MFTLPCSVLITPEVDASTLWYGGFVRKIVGVIIHSSTYTTSAFYDITEGKYKPNLPRYVYPKQPRFEKLRNMPVSQSSERAQPKFYNSLVYMSSPR